MPARGGGARRSSAAGVWASFSSVPSAVGARAVGLEPLGDRAQLAARARRTGADGVLTSTLTLQEPSDLTCQALVRGTAIDRVTPADPRPGRATTATTLPLRTDRDG